MNNAWRIFGVISAFIFVFLAGVVIGGCTMALVTRNRFLEFQHQRELEQVQRRAEREADLAKERLQEQQLTQQIASLRQQIQAQQDQRLVWQQRGTSQGGGSRRMLPTPEQFGAQLMQGFVNRLQPAVTQAQREQIRPMVFETAEELRRLRRDTAHTTEVLIEQLQDKIAAVLTPAQRSRFDDMIQHWRDNVQRFNREQQQRMNQQRMQEQHRPAQGQPPAPPAPATPAPAAPAAAAPATSATP